MSAQKGTNLNFVVLQIHMLHKLYLVLMYMYKGHLQNIKHLYLYASVIRIYGIIILDETTMNNFIIFLSSPCMYGRGNSRVMQGVVELRTDTTFR